MSEDQTNNLENNQINQNSLVTWPCVDGRQPPSGTIKYTTFGYNQIHHKIKSPTADSVTVSVTENSSGT